MCIYIYIDIDIDIDILSQVLKDCRYMDDLGLGAVVKTGGQFNVPDSVTW